MFTNDRILCDDRCGAVFALRREEGLNRARQRARQDGWRWDGVGDWCPASLHRTRLTPGHDPLHGTELR